MKKLIRKKSKYNLTQKQRLSLGFNKIGRLMMKKQYTLENNVSVK